VIVRYIAIFAAASLLLVTGHCAPHFESTNRIGLLCIGDTSYGESPILGWLSLDFAVQWQELPTDVQGVLTNEEARKVTRIYTPRTLERLLDQYDMLLLLEPRMHWFSLTEMDRFKRSVDDGVSALLTLWPDTEGYLSLVQTELASVFPQDFPQVYKNAEFAPFRIEVVENNPPVLDVFIPVGIERITGEDTRPMFPRQGSTVWAWANKPSLSRIPKDEFIISWSYGDNDAENWVIGIDVDESWFRLSSGNEYGGDLVLNMIYYSVGKELPPDIFLVHQLRDSFHNYNIRKNLIYSTIEFIDDFGANTIELERAIGEADDGRSVARDLFLEGEYEASYQKIQEMIEGITELNEEAVRLKERALLWIYITEWSAVTGTAVLAGFVLYSLMIRRRLYKEVAITRPGTGRR